MRKNGRDGVETLRDASCNETSAVLEQVAEGAAEMYVVQLGQLRSLSPAGSAQLAADLEYFCNVVSALGVSIPPALATWQVGAVHPHEQDALLRQKLQTSLACQQIGCVPCFC